MNHPVNLKRSDGKEIEITYSEDKPWWILIKASRPNSGNLPPHKDEHDRFDFNEREIKPWQARFDKFIIRQMQLFSEEQYEVKAFHVNSIKPIAGYVPDKK